MGKGSDQNVEDPTDKSSRSSFSVSCFFGFRCKGQKEGRNSLTFEPEEPASQILSPRSPPVLLETSFLPSRLQERDCTGSRWPPRIGFGLDQEDGSGV